MATDSAASAEPTWSRAVADRRQPNLTELLGTALIQLFPDVLTHAEARTLTPKEIIARFRKSYDVHHWTYVAVLGGSNHPTNLSWMAAAEHDERTRKIDVPTIAKLKRHAKKSDAKPKQRIRSRGFPSKEERASARAFLAGRRADQADRQRDLDGSPVASPREIAGRVRGDRSRPRGLGRLAAPARPV